MIDKNSLVMIGDMDSISWIVGFNHRDKDNVDKVLQDVDKFIQTLIDNTSCTHYIGFLGGSKEVFRHRLAVTRIYKGQRKESPDWYIKWGGVIKAHLRDVWHFQVVNDIEADDAVSIAAHELRFLDINYIICGADKDLLQIEGNHYNLRSHQRSFISPLEASKNLYRQILIGDVTDGIEGLKGIGKKKASQYIDGLNNVMNMNSQCIQLYSNKYGTEKGTKMYVEMFKMCSLLHTPLPYTHLSLDYIEVKRPDIFKDTTLDKIIADIWS